MTKYSNYFLGDNFFSGSRGLFPLSFVIRLTPKEIQGLLMPSEERKMTSRSLTL